jgi:hypothetical protein
MSLALQTLRITRRGGDVGYASEPSLYHLMNHLAAIKLAVELLEQRADLTDDQHALAETAIHAADALVADLVSRSPEPPPAPLHVS